MIKKLEELLNEAHAMKRPDRMECAKKKVEEIKAFCKQVGMNDTQMYQFISHLFKLFVAADGKIKMDEYYAFKEITGADITAEQFINAEKTNYSDYYQLLMKELKTISVLPEDIRLTIATFGIMLIASDGAIDQNEAEVLEKILLGKMD